jgi:hydroxymethylpyrimidine pyrophosphatase-like HAD family hydrolase
MRFDSGDWVRNMNKKILFACDLDDTLLHSHRKKRGGDICVEYLYGRPQGYISPALADALRRAPESFDLIPVTTRSAAQFARIDWGMVFPIRYAILANGGAIFAEGAPMPGWAALVDGVMSDAAPVLGNIREMFEMHGEPAELIDAVMVRANETACCNLLAKEIEAEYGGRVYGFQNGRKRYFLPAGISKKDALAYLLETIDFDILIAAGDSEADTPMLSISDLAIVPGWPIAERIRGPSIMVNDSETDFSDFIAEIINYHVNNVRRM